MLREVNSSQSYWQIVKGALLCAQVCFRRLPSLCPAILPSSRCRQPGDEPGMKQCEAWSAQWMGRQRKMICLLNSITRHVNKIVFPRTLISKVNNVSEIGEYFLALCPMDGIFSGWQFLGILMAGIMYFAPSCHHKKCLLFRKIKDITSGSIFSCQLHYLESYLIGIIFDICCYELSFGISI